MIHLPHTDALCALTQPYCLDSVPDGLFDQAMGEISLFIVTTRLATNAG